MAMRAQCFHGARTQLRFLSQRPTVQICAPKDHLENMRAENLRCEWKITNTPRGSTQRLTMGKRVKRHAHQRTSNRGYLAFCASQATCQATKGRTPSGGHPSRPEKVQPDQAGYSVSPQRVALALKARTAQVCGPVPQAAPSRCVPTMPAEITLVSQLALGSTPERKKMAR